jgi:hypothetical protein
MTARTTLIGLVAGPLALAGCASSEATAPSSTTTPEQSVTATTARQGGSPQEAAQLPCSDAVHGQVQEVLGLDSVPTPESVWADDRATCTYQTPMGPLVYAVTVGTTPAAAQDHFETLRSSLRATTPVAGLPEAYRNGQGVVVAIEDTLVLSVDAGALPREHLGPDHQSHTGVAIVLATGVLHAWAGQD